MQKCGKCGVKPRAGGAVAHRTRVALALPCEALVPAVHRQAVQDVQLLQRSGPNVVMESVCGGGGAHPGARHRARLRERSVARAGPTRSCRCSTASRKRHTRVAVHATSPQRASTHTHKHPLARKGRPQRRGTSHTGASHHLQGGVRRPQRGVGLEVVQQPGHARHGFHVHEATHGGRHGVPRPAPARRRPHRHGADHATPRRLVTAVHMAQPLPLVPARRPQVAKGGCMQRERHRVREKEGGGGGGGGRAHSQP
jgi:hypothetical protein